MRRRIDAMEERYGLAPLTYRARQLVVASYLLLLLLLAVGGWMVQQTTEGGIMPLLIRLLPLVLFLPSIVMQRPRGHAWLAFVSLLYFMQGVMIATLPGFGILGILECLASLALFLGCTGYARFRSKQLRQQDIRGR